MDDRDNSRGREMDLNLYLGFPSLVQLGPDGDSAGPGDSEDLLQNAEVIFPIPVRTRQHWRSRNRRQQLQTSNDTNIDSVSQSTRLQSGGNDSEVAELVLMNFINAREEIGNTVNPFERSGGTAGPQNDNGQDRKEQKPGANFECNICFEFAKEPVVTSCGHLFCWTCLYQWLHVHSNSKECPVCKGLVTDSNIIPIYGRGDGDREKTCDVESSSGLKLPPRPHGLRLESLRQRMLMSRSPEDASFHLDEILNGIHSQYDVDSDRGIAQTQQRVRPFRRYFAQGWYHPYGRLRLPARRSRVRMTTMRRGHVHSQDSSAGSDSWDSSFVSNVWQRINQNHLEGHERLSSISSTLANMENIIARFASETGSSSLFGDSINPTNLEERADRAVHEIAAVHDPALTSTSAGVVQDNELGENQVELSGMGNSPSRRRRQSAPAGSSAENGERSNGRKRRRLN